MHGVHDRSGFVEELSRRTNRTVTQNAVTHSRESLLRLDSEPLALSSARCRASRDDQHGEPNLAKRGWLLRLDSNQQPSG
jgi:hypothetical protein